ncbi:MAG: ABC transporter permease, partial [Bryobacteraceae bacterium]
GYAAALAAVAASALATPALVIGAARVVSPMMRRRFGADGLLAVRGLVAALPRTSVIVAAISTALAVMIGVAVMVGSFRETVRVWLDHQLRADLYVRPGRRSGAGQFPPLPAGVVERVRQAAGVDAVDVFHALEIRFGGRRATLGAGEIDIVRRYGRLRFLPGQDRDAVLRSLPGADRAIVSEPFAEKHGLRAGDRIALPLGEREVTLEIAGVYYDYSSELGWIILDRSTLLKHLPHQPATNLAVYGAGARAGVERAVAGQRVIVGDSAALRRASLEVFDRTFAITWALEAVAVLVAMLGAASSLVALVLDRRREIGVLRFLGAAPEQVKRMILLEAGFLGLVASGAGLALGGALSLLLIFVINKHSFGWTIQFHPPAGLVAGALALVWCATVVAALYPARMAARLNPGDAVHHE